MRVLSLSHRLQHPRFDNYSIVTAPNLMDYDAIVVDIAGTFDVITQVTKGEGYWETFDGQQISNGSDIDDQLGLAGLLERRRDELVAALDNGAIVVVFGAAPKQTFKISGGANGLDSYWLLPAPSGLNWDRHTLLGSAGDAVVISDYSNPFLKVFETYETDVEYQMRFEDTNPVIQKNASVFLRSAGGAAVGAEFKVLNGTIVFLPSPKSIGATWLSNKEAQAILIAVSDALGRIETDVPYWVGKLAIPEIDRLTQNYERVVVEKQAAEEALELAEAELASRKSLGTMLWGAGQQYSTAIREGLKILGFDESSVRSDPIEFKYDGDELFVECDASEEIIEMTSHYALRQRLDAKIDKSAKAVRGLVVINGQRMTDIAQRQREVSQSLRVAAESTGYGVMHSRELFGICMMVLEEKIDESSLVDIRTRITTTNGLIDLQDLVSTDDEAAQ
ncbi:MAG: hypothetical protein P8J64_04395 [Dehalococcoidia bacterium]|nr:hypothetical protein [Dehalococcoidia bacterium]